MGTRRVLNSARLWHKQGAVNSNPDKKPRPPLDPESLQRLALFYVGRYATTRSKLRGYLERKLRERGWTGPGPDIVALVERLRELGYVDDGAFASARAASLQRRGYGERRIRQALQAAGIGDEDAGRASDHVRENELMAALRFAERKRIGPFASHEPDRQARQKAFAAMMRAGHPLDVVRQVLNASAEDIPDLDKD